MSEACSGALWSTFDLAVLAALQRLTLPDAPQLISPDRVPSCRGFRLRNKSGGTLGCTAAPLICTDQWGEATCERAGSGR